MAEILKKAEQNDVDSDDDEELKKEEAEETKAAEPEEDTSLASSDVITKYQEAGKIAQSVLMEVAARCVLGAKLVDICRFGDNLIEERAQAIFRGKNKAGKAIERGIAFPVCISVNECVCHCSPLESDDTYPVLAENDMVKIDLGVHVDGYIAVAAHTVVVHAVPFASGGAPETGPRANVLAAAWAAAEVAARMIKPGNIHTPTHPSSSSSFPSSPPSTHHSFLSSVPATVPISVSAPINPPSQTTHSTHPLSLSQATPTTR